MRGKTRVLLIPKGSTTQVTSTITPLVIELIRTWLGLMRPNRLRPSTLRGEDKNLFKLNLNGEKIDVSTWPW